jgi:hypothetical protein
MENSVGLWLDYTFVFLGGSEVPVRVRDENQAEQGAQQRSN